MKFDAEKYTQNSGKRQIPGACADGLSSGALSRASAGKLARPALLCLAALLALAACSKGARSSLGPLGQSGALSTQAVQPAPTGATEGGQVGFFLDLSGSITVRQLGPNGSAGNRPSAGGAAPAGGPQSLPGAQGAPIPPRIGDPIYAPDSIETGVDSSCRIQFGENALVELTPRSHIEIPAFPKVPVGGTPPPPVVIVEGGTVLFSVARQAAGDALLATAGTAAVGTAGADFLIARLGSATDIAVGRGAVRVGRGLSAGAEAAAPSAEAILKSGLGPSPTLLRAGYQLSVPSAGKGVPSGGAATPVAPSASGTAPAGEPELAPQPLSSAYRALLFRNDRSALPPEPLMTPQPPRAGAGSPAAVSPTTGDSPAATGASAPAAGGGSAGSGASVAPAPSGAAAGGGSAASRASGAASPQSAGASASSSAAPSAPPAGADPSARGAARPDGGPTPPAAPAAPSLPTPPSLRSAD